MLLSYIYSNQNWFHYFLSLFTVLCHKPGCTFTVYSFNNQSLRSEPIGFYHNCPQDSPLVFLRTLEVGSVVSFSLPLNHSRQSVNISFFPCAGPCKLKPLAMTFSTLLYSFYPFILIKYAAITKRQWYSTIPLSYKNTTYANTKFVYQFTSRAILAYNKIFYIFMQYVKILTSTIKVVYFTWVNTRTPQTPLRYTKSPRKRRIHR